MVASRTSAAKRNKSHSKTGVTGRNIVLFSDGTGNSSAKVFKTNVWRMYEAVDLGPSPPDQRDQISFYDDGVGTSGFKLLAALGGAFGWGLKRNVLDLYRYACRNYRDGDQIYGFGFSRGAFTIRIVISLIASQGLVQSADESELNRNTSRAYREFRRAFQPRKFKGLTRLGRGIRDWFIARYDSWKKLPPYNRNENHDADIRFVGVWDTVAAYGGPITEITRAIDNWIYPLSMPNYELDEKIECARHALALDDERDAFWPLLWDEVAEAREAEASKAAKLDALEKARKARSEAQKKKYRAEAKSWGEREQHFRKRMQQVWFCGMHADVGGGYPDESLSYVSLLWMIEEAKSAGLRTLDTIKDRYFALANSYGPMHNSRSGFGAYYRYQPRKIAAWLNPLDPRYLMLQDPDVTDPSGKQQQGLLNGVKVHESVIARINSGTVRYAPISLPERFEIIPPQLEGETVEQDSSEGAAREGGLSEPLVEPGIRSRLADGAADRFECQENLWDLVWKRRIAYFATVAATVLLLALPVWHPPLNSIINACSDSRCVLPSLIRPLGALLPGFADPWVEAVALYPYIALLLGLAIWWLLHKSGSLERRLWDGSYRLWRSVLDGQPTGDCPTTWLREKREGPVYQTSFRELKWYALPGLFGILMTLVILYVPTVAISQAVIQIDEADHAFCAADDPNQLHPIAERAQFWFTTRSHCINPNLKLEEGQVYDVVFQLPVEENGEPVAWWDDTMHSKPGSFTRVPASSFPQVIGVPMRRVIEASYLQPIIQTTRTDEDPNPSLLHQWVHRVTDRLFPNFQRVHITKLDLKQDDNWPELYRVRFRATHDSSLHMFANDVHMPFAGNFFYDNNCGRAWVTITKIKKRGLHMPAQQLVTDPDFVLTKPPCANRPDRVDKLKGETAH